MCRDSRNSAPARVNCTAANEVAPARLSNVPSRTPSSVPDIWPCSLMLGSELACTQDACVLRTWKPVFLSCQEAGFCGLVRQFQEPGHTGRLCNPGSPLDVDSYGQDNHAATAGWLD